VSERNDCVAVARIVEVRRGAAWRLVRGRTSGCSTSLHFPPISSAIEAQIVREPC
jgi:hypothetical protein